MGAPTGNIIEREDGTKMKKSIHDEIAKVAYELYEKEGSVDGKDFARSVASSFSR
jgi:hypothetical protein